LSKDPFEARRVGFEAEYFQKKDAELVDKLKKIFHKKLEKDELRKSTGIHDERVLDTLLELNVSSNLLAAFELYPLVEVAWADGGVDEREQAAALAAAEKHGIAAGSPAHAMLADLLKNRPRADMRKAWNLFAEELRRTLTPRQLDVFREDLLAYARSVATASGGLLNIAFAVGASEREALKSIERALTPE